MTNNAPKKRGQLSLDEEKFIRDNIETMSAQDIADAIKVYRLIHKYMKAI